MLFANVNVVMLVTVIIIRWMPSWNDFQQQQKCHTVHVCCIFSTLKRARAFGQNVDVFAAVQSRFKDNQMQSRQKLVRTGVAIHPDIGGRVIRTCSFNMHLCKEREYLIVYFMMMTVM